jgi:serine/threonine protein kinase
MSIIRAQNKEKHVNNEINTQEKLNSLNVVKLIDVGKTKENIYLILEYCNGIDLQKY